MGSNTGDNQMTDKEKSGLNKKIDIGVRRGAAKAHEEHKKAGRPIYIWKDGKVVEVPSDQIILSEEKTDEEKRI